MRAKLAELRARLIFSKLVVIAAVLMLMVLIFLDFLLYEFAVNTAIWSKLSDLGLQGVRDHLFAFAQIIAVVFLLLLGVLLVAFAWRLLRYLSSRDNEITVLPFQTATGEDKFNGRAIADAFTSRWLNIVKIHNRNILLIRSERISSPQMQGNTEDIGTAVANVATAGVGSTTVSIGQLLVALRKLSPSGNTGVTLTGGLQRYGPLVCLTARQDIGSKTGVRVSAWDIARETKNEHEIDELVKDLTFKVFHDMNRTSKDLDKTEGPNGSAELASALWSPSDDSNGIEAKTWEAFKAFTEALDAYHRYKDFGEHPGDLDNARLSIIQAFELEPDYELTFDLLYFIGYAYAAKGDSKAEELFRLATELRGDIDPIRRSEAFAFLGWSKIKDGDTNNAPDAISALRSALDLDPSFPFAWSNLGIAYDLHEDFERATEAHQKALDLKDSVPPNEQPTHPDWAGRSEGIYISAFWLRTLGHYDRALSRCQTAIDEADGYEPDPPHILMSDLLIGRDNIPEALKQCKQAAAKYSEPDQTHQILNQEALIHMISGRDNEAMSLVRTILEQDPKYVDAWYQMAIIRYRQQRYDDAIRLAKKVRNLAPEAAQVHVTLASIYRMIGRTDESKSEVAIARTQLGEDSKDPYTFACLESVAGNVDESLRLLEIAIRNKQMSLDWIRYGDPDLDFIRSSWRFKVLMRSHSPSHDYVSQAVSKIMDLFQAAKAPIVKSRKNPRPFADYGAHAGH